MAKAAKTKLAPTSVKIPAKGAKKRLAAKAPKMGAGSKLNLAVPLQQARAQALSLHAEPDVLNRLFSIIEQRRSANPVLSHSARLLGRGTAKVAQKFGEEAVECLIEIVAGNRTAAIAESADVLYHLLLMWVEAGIRPEEVWLELEKREEASNLAEGSKGPSRKLRKGVELGTSKIP